MTIGNSGIDGNFLSYPGQAANTILANNTGGTASPTAVSVSDAQTLLQITPGSKATTYSFVSGSNATTTGQSLVDITGLTFAAAAASTYEIEAALTVSTTAVTTGTEYAVQYSASGAAVEAQIIGSLTSTATKSERISALNTATSAFLTTSAQSGQVLIKGIVTTGANTGNITVQHLKVTSGTSTVFINSYLKVTKVA